MAIKFFLPFALLDPKYHHSMKIEKSYKHSYVAVEKGEMS